MAHIVFSRFSSILASLYAISFIGVAADIPSSLRERVSNLQAGQSVPVIVSMRDRVDLRLFPHRRSSAPAVIRALQERERQTQGTVKALLAREGYKGRMQSFWINNSLAIEVDQRLLEKISQLAEVDRIEVDEAVRFAEDRWHSGNPPAGVSTAQWNIVKVQADSVWIKYGLDGTGIVLGSMDTGMDTSHPALAGRWRGGTNSWKDFVNHRPDPYDDHGHGTHTIGTMTGGDGPGPYGMDIGIAYNAKVISVKVLDATNSFSSASTVISGAQWMMDPDENPSTNDFPNAINNSWFFYTRGYTGFYTTVEAWRAIGIIPVFCAGNFGPGPGTTRSPGDYNNCMSVGGTNSADEKYSNTSEGPSPTGSDFPADQRKPDFSAPGQLVTSSLPGGAFGSWSGTSMATPHITATAALMLEANSSLTYDQIYAILRKSSADLGAPDYDSVFGYGRTNSLKAVEEAFRAKTLVEPDTVLVTTEAGGIADAHVSLATQPSSDVRLSIRSSDTTEGIPLQSELTFTSFNWWMPQTIQIRGADDSVVDGDQSYRVNFSLTSDDPLYNNIPAPSILLTNKDNDTARLVISPAFIAFTDTQVSCREDARLVLHNAGIGPITIASITASDSDFAVSPAIVSASIPEGDSLVLDVTFAPLNAGLHRGWVLIEGANASFTDSVEVIGSATGPSPAIVLTVKYWGNGWQLISQPVRTNCPYFFSPCPWWLYCYSNPFIYSAGYVYERRPIEPGTGFWLKLGSPSFRFVGFPITEDTIKLQTGWNLIGSISFPVPTNSITTVPPDLLTGLPFFGYNGYYYIATAIQPGYGYWIRSRGTGLMILRSTMSAAQSIGHTVLQEIADNIVTISDAAGNNQSLYLSMKPLDESTLERFTLPPVAPDASFDVRFGSGRMLEAIVRSQDRIPISILSATYPLTIRWSVESPSELAIELDNRVVGLEGSGMMRLSTPPNRFALVRRSSVESPTGFSLEQNYPNPFNPGTLLNYALKNRSKVSLKIFDLLGHEIRTLVDGIENPGVRSVEWDGRSANGTNMAGGVYLYQIEAHSVDGSTQSFRATRKMALIR